MKLFALEQVFLHQYHATTQPKPNLNIQQQHSSTSPPNNANGGLTVHHRDFLLPHAAADDDNDNNNNNETHHHHPKEIMGHERQRKSKTWITAAFEGVYEPLKPFAYPKSTTSSNELLLKTGEWKPSLNSVAVATSKGRG
jgi:hypothetical protein